MNREEAKKLLPIIQAFAEGKTIQWRDPVKDTWVDESVPNWNPSAEYRIKPDPREVWAVFRNGILWGVRSTEESANLFVAGEADWWNTEDAEDAEAWSDPEQEAEQEYEVVKFREVVDE